MHTCGRLPTRQKYCQPVFDMIGRLLAPVLGFQILEMVQYVALLGLFEALQ